MPALPLSDLLLHTATAVQAVRGGRSLTDALAAVPDAPRPGTQALAFEVLRRLGGAQAVRQHLAPKTPPPKVEGLLLCALALLWPQDAPAYAAFTVVDETVEACKRRFGASAGFVNAVLRRFVREQAACVAAAERDASARWNHPHWWIERLRADWPAHWQALLMQAQTRPPMTLRVNARQTDATAYAAELQATGRACTVLGSHSLMLHAPCRVDDLPGFAQGRVSVQDASAQQAAPLLLGEGRTRWATGTRVLDACAAPGGKTAHLLELADVQVLALDSDAQRLRRVADTLARLKLSAELKAADARQPERWWDGRRFEAILLDAPCSASGIVRRHPDIRWLRRADDIAALARTQAELLDALWPLLAPGGRLLYATCSVFKAEGQAQIDAFLQRPAGRNARLDPASPGHLLPLPDNRGAGGPPSGDGFFYALLHHVPD
jgi:16S rRNA (cytosine967-C5)-methyltransferase